MFPPPFSEQGREDIMLNVKKQSPIPRILMPSASRSSTRIFDRGCPIGNERRFVDTDFLLRYLTNDVPEQADAVEELLHKAAIGGVTLLTNSLVMAEMVWTLESFYQLERTDIREKVRAILNTPGLQVVDADLVLTAIVGYVEKNVDFIDAYNVAWMLSHGITSAYTFDRKHFNRFDGITVQIPKKMADDSQD